MGFHPALCLALTMSCMQGQGQKLSEDGVHSGKHGPEAPVRECTERSLLTSETRLWVTLLLFTFPLSSVFSAQQTSFCVQSNFISVEQTNVKIPRFWVYCLEIPK